MGEERRVFHFDGGTVRLSLTELQGRLEGCPTKHVLAVWEDGGRLKEAFKENPVVPVFPFWDF